tara:strand:- start:22 stop:219 length:198 start_codon:yes stop_codon:yes gene_type:complete
MKSFEEEFYLENPSRYQIIKRDIRLFFWLLKRALMWLGKGLLIRIAYKKAKNSGEPLVIEEVIKD